MMVDELRTCTMQFGAKGFTFANNLKVTIYFIFINEEGLPLLGLNTNMYMSNTEKQ